MTTTEKLTRIKATLRHAIELGENVTGIKWQVSSSTIVCDERANIISNTIQFEGLNRIGITEASHNAAFIATSRQLLPATAKAMLDDIEAWQNLIGAERGKPWTLRQPDLCRMAQARLDSLANSFPDEVLI